MEFVKNENIPLSAYLTYTDSNTVTVWFQWSKDTFAHVVKALKELDQREFDNQTIKSIPLNKKYTLE
jgi:hypothetical protein